MTRHPLLDLPPFPDDGYARLADRLATMLGTAHDLIWVQAEAILALEAVATSLARPGLRALNLVTSPYGALFGGWLRRAGATVSDLRPTRPGMPVTLDAVAEALRAGADIIALVHAESASGILNPLPEIAALARAAGALTVVDAVASVGGHPLAIDALGLDVVVAGPQKALAGPAGLSAVAMSPRAWAMAGHPGAPRGSALSLVDIRAQWLDTGRGALPGMPSALEWWALEAALDRIAGEGIAATITRHAEARSRCRAALTALGLELFVPDPAQASALVTTALLPAPDSLAGAPPALHRAVEPAIGDLGGPVIRFNHTGERARPAVVADGVMALADRLGTASTQRDAALATLSPNATDPPDAPQGARLPQRRR